MKNPVIWLANVIIICWVTDSEQRNNFCDKGKTMETSLKIALGLNIWNEY